MDVFYTIEPGINYKLFGRFMISDLEKIYENWVVTYNNVKRTTVKGVKL